MPQASPWWAPEIHADRQPFLQARRRILAALRGHLEAQDFVEVETAILQRSPGNETHLHAFATELVAPDRTRMALHLHTSPEFACKKLLAAGERRIFEFARVFRNRERGALHHPEFTMLEWYRVAEPYEALMADCADFLAAAATAAGATTFTFRGRSADPFAAPERVTVAAAFARHAGIDLPATLRDGEPDRAALAAQAQAAGIRLAPDDGWSDIFSRALVERIEPHLGNGRATLLTEYPRAEAALARAKPGEPGVAERFELFVCGIELANAFVELTDVAEQRARFVADRAHRHALAHAGSDTPPGHDWPLDEDFLAALAHGMPASAGIALGFDRLAMIAAGADRIDQVLWL
jgi:elongation factor P--(R)-beta-lysine ligase